MFQITSSFFFFLCYNETLLFLFYQNISNALDQYSLMLYWNTAIAVFTSNNILENNLAELTWSGVCPSLWDITQRFTIQLDVTAKSFNEGVFIQTDVQYLPKENKTHLVRSIWYEKLPPIWKNYPISITVHKIVIRKVRRVVIYALYACTVDVLTERHIKLFFIMV